MSQLISDVTRPGLHQGTCIDWIISNSKFVRTSYVTNIFLSDHFAVECVRKKSRECHKNVYRTLRDYKNYNKDDLVNLLALRLSIDVHAAILDPNDMWVQLYTNVYQILSVMCPYKNYKQRQNPTPWISADVYRAMRYRDSLINLYKSTKNSFYLTLAKRQRNLVNSMIQCAKRTYICPNLQNNSSSPNKFWRHMNLLLKSGASGCKSLHQRILYPSGHSHFKF